MTEDKKAFPQFPGNYRGVVTRHKIDSTKNGFCQFVAECKLVQQQDVDTKEYRDMRAPEFITAYISLEKGDKKTGEIVKNDNQISTLSQAFGWDGKSLGLLAAQDLSEIEVGFVLKQEKDQKGEDRIQVAWINSTDYFATNMAKVKSIEARWGNGSTDDAESPAEPAAPVEKF